ncbi:MAG TPA: AI-2E family transporter [Chloroflexota bacterium]
MMQRDWQNILRLSVVLAVFLVVLAALALLYVVIQVLQHFGGVLVLFVVGAMLAYVLNPAVSRVTAKVGKRWAGTLIVYVGVAAALALVGVLVFEPLVTQSSSLVSALNSPSTRSLSALSRIADEATAIRSDLHEQRATVVAGHTVPQSRIHHAETGIAALQGEMAALQAKPAPFSPHTPASRRTSPAPWTRIPPSYLRPLQSSIAALKADYGRPTRRQHPSSLSFTRSLADADAIVREARALQRTVSSTPILLLDAQTWADQHHIGVNVQASAGQALKKASDQAASLLSNTATILTQTGALLLDLVLTLIISVYFVSDGEGMIQRSIALLPDAYQTQAATFLTRVDDILGGYIRGQLLLALLAGTLGGFGAAVLGVPYPVVIGVGTFLLQLLPVIGPMLVYIPPVIVSLLFTSVPTTVVLLAYFILFEQLVTNVIGPRVNSKSVGIHPLEAMAAALVGYPLGGFLGAFLAVPVAGIAHVVVKEAYETRRTKPSTRSRNDDGETATAEQPGPGAVRQLTASSGRSADRKES